MIGPDRVQLVCGRRVRWEVPYAEVARLRVCPGPLQRWLGVAAGAGLGVCLRDPGRFDAAWPRQARRRAALRGRWGVDLVVPLFLWTEPAALVLEALRARWHRCRSAASVATGEAPPAR